jgi:hypothetical protein
LLNHSSLAAVRFQFDPKLLGLGLLQLDLEHAALSVYGLSLGQQFVDRLTSSSAGGNLSI